MASAYSGQISYSTQADAVSALMTWMQDEAGFTIESAAATVVTGTPGSGGTTYTFSQAVASLNGKYFWIIWSGTRGMYCRMTKNLSDGTVSWGSRTNNCSLAKRFGGLGPTGGTYRFYQTDGAVHARFTCTLGGKQINQFFSAGALTKVGSWTGGEYMTCSYFVGQSSASTLVENINGYEANILFRETFSATAAPTNDRLGFGALSLEAAGMNFGLLDMSYGGTGGVLRDQAHFIATRGGPACRSALSGTLSSYNMRSNLHSHPHGGPNGYNNRVFAPPVTLWGQMPSGTNEYKMLGTVPGIRFVNMKLHNDGDVINTDWHVFALTIKGTVGVANVVPPSANLGVAFRFQ